MAARRAWVALAFALALAGAAGAWVAGQPSTRMAPDFTVSGASGNTTFHLADARGKTVVLDFMAVNCATCLTLTDEVLLPFAEATQGRTDVVLVSIDVWSGLPGQVGETPEDVSRLQRDQGATWLHAVDHGQVLRAYGITGLPQLTVVDPGGNVVRSVAAPDRMDLAGLQSAVAVSAAGQGAGRLVQYSLPALALVAGAAAIFSPCSIGMVPTYFALLLDQPGDGAGRRRGGPLRAGALAAAGMLAVYVVLALALWAAGDRLRGGVRWLGPAAGLLLVLLGALSLAGYDWSRWTRPLPSADPRRGFVAFGAAYGLASFGCTGPLFLPILVAGFLAGADVGLTVFTLYAGALALLLLTFAALVETGRETWTRRLLAPARAIHTGAAVVMLAAGLYLVWYDLHAYGYL